MKNKRIAGISMIVLVMLAAFLLLVHKNQIDLEISKPKIRLPILISGGDASWETCVKEVAAQYMQEYPEIDVEVKTSIELEGSDYNNSLIIEEALGNFDGIVEMRNQNLYAQAKKIVPIPKEVSDLLNPVNEIDGQIYSIPRFYTCRGIIYNKKIFKQYGLKEPTNYQEFLQLCNVLKTKDISPLVVGAGDRWHLKNWINVLFSKNLEENYSQWITLRNEGQVHWADKEPRKIISDFKKLFESGYVEPGYQTTTDTQTIEVLTEGRAAMLYSGTWMFSQIQKADQDFELGWFFLPDEKGKPIIDTVENVGWSITSSCAENKDMYTAATEFLKYYYSTGIYRTVLQEMNGIPTLKKEVTYDTIPIQQDILKQIREYGTSGGENLDSPMVPEGVSSDICEILYRMIVQDKNVDDVVSDLDKEWDEKLEKKK
ncbi:MAG: ABC transporter substrate-binding protein [bacterium]|nr:ABC transporter substrate-binding protein [bacterium]